MFKFHKITLNLIILFSVLFLSSNMLFASECKKSEESVDGIVIESYEPLDITSLLAEPKKPEMSLQSNSIFSPDVEQFINGTELSHVAGLPDPNETVEALKAYLEGIEKVKKSIKKRFFDDPIDTVGSAIEDWLNGALKRVLSAKEKYPESRHVSEVLGRIYKELYAHTNNDEYLTRAADAFIFAEEMGIKHGMMAPHYTFELSDILSTLADRHRLDRYFSKIIELDTDNYYAYLYYAKALSRLSDQRADQFFEKAVSMRQDGDFQPVVDYAEHLLNVGKNKKALITLQELGPQEDYAFYPHFLKGLALEKIGRVEEAKKEYSRYLEFRGINKMSANEGEWDIPVDDGLFRPPSRFKIQGSELQKDILFTNEQPISSGKIVSASQKRDTPNCGSTDWACKARYYMVWTINGEAEKAGYCGNHTVSGTTGMMRAVGWNVRTRVFIQKGIISCSGSENWCFNWAPDYKLIANDVNSVYKRYWGVIETGGYAGLAIGNYTSISEQVFYDVFNGRVPDPIAGRCLNGYLNGSSCDGTCTSSGIWNSFWSYQSGPEFRAGKVEQYFDWGIQCYKFVPMSPPTWAFCGKQCYDSKGPICPQYATPGGFQCRSDGQGWYYYNGPCYGNIFYRFNM